MAMDAMERTRRLDRLEERLSELRRYL